MLYTRKGDDGTTQTFGCDQRISKSSSIAEALGTLDEINSFLGIVRFHSDDEKISKIIFDIQQNLFIVQAELAGAEKTIIQEKVTEIEKIIDEIEKKLPPIKTFFVSGGMEFSALLDFARTLARRAERRVISVAEEGKVKISAYTLAYLNRLSSLLYALARLVNFQAGISENAPDYK